MTHPRPRMKSPAFALLGLAALFPSLPAHPALAEDAAAWKPLFNGTDLAGWEGQPGAWEVRDGAIWCTGEATGKNWLVWRGGEPGDFVLRMEFRWEKGNSGVQVRSDDLGGWQIFGYQVEVAERDKMGLWHHSLLDKEHPKKEARHLMTTAGQRARIDAAGERTVEPFADTAEVQAAYREGEWNQLEIVAEGPRLVQKINGVVFAELVDEDTEMSRRKGWIALQDHGKDCRVAFRKIELKETASGDSLGELIFSDDFERSESQELKDEPGKGWGTNSKGRAKGHKQVDLRDGAMHIFLHAEADHAVSVTQPVAFTDGAVALRFQLEDARDSLGLNFADLEFKEVHAGHLFVVKVDPKKVVCQDLKTGNMRLDIREARTAKTPLDAEQQAALEGKDKAFPHPLSLGEWHDLLVRIAGDEVAVEIDGAEVGRFRSPGIAHPTKRLLRLAVPRNAVVDEVRIWRTR